MKKKYRSIENIKSSYGRRFVLLWEIGLVLFIIVPMITTIIYSLSDVTAGQTGLEYKFVGLSNFNYVINVDKDFLNYMGASFVTMLYSVPAILVISLVIAIILSKEFKGRIIFRTLYFLPVIIATGVVIQLILRCTSASLTSSAGVAQTEKNDMINVAEVLSWLNLKGKFVTYFQAAISGIFTLVWASGVQIVLFIAGMQSIPDTLYEVSKVEGATKWEEFWFITLPMLSRVIILVTIFTIVELINDKTNKIISYIYTLMSSLQYAETSAMLWIYFAVTGAFIALVMFAFTHFCAKRWEA